MEIVDKESCQYFHAIFDEQKNGANSFANEIQKLGAKPLILVKSMIFVLNNIFKISKFIKSNKINIICSHDYKSNFYAVIVARIFGMPAISVFHGRTGTDWKSTIYEKFDDWIRPFFSRIVSVSNYTALNAISPALRSKIVIIPNAVKIENVYGYSSPENFKRELGIADDDFVILYAGRLSREKGIQYLIAAAESIIKKHKNIKFLILGEGAERKSLESFVSQKDLHQYVKFLGFQQDIDQYFELMDVLILPSLSEGMPLVILEAFVHRKPVIANDVGGISEVVSNYENGILTKSGDIDSLHKAIEYCKTHRKETVSYGENGYKMIQQKYNFDRQMQNYVALYRDLLTGNEIIDNRLW
jgi:glycosyltransferase involved in cell wall biosynthesis